MSTLSKVTVIDKIEVLEDHTLQIRQATRILEDDKELSSSFHRWVLHPGADLTGQDAKIVAIANALWTPEVISAYEAAAQANTVK